MRRGLNAEFDSIKYSTPSFYPIKPEYWETVRGPWNGYGIIADGRRREILLGDKYFSPFVSAGWSSEESNIRPSQWLSLLKAMTMLGAKFFYVGYFNVTNAKGWPNGNGPNDPRGYIYQVAMPAYAQAIAQKFNDFVELGELINPRNEKEWLYTYRFKGSKPNQLILIRRLNNSYLIQGSIQINSNYSGELPETENTTIRLNDIELTFPIRRQGSTYILKLKPIPVFYQLDGWHEFGHPSFWSKNIIMEGELYDSTVNSSIHTENFISNSEKSLNFSNSLSFIKLKKNGYLQKTQTSCLRVITLSVR